MNDSSVELTSLNSLDKDPALAYRRLHDHYRAGLFTYIIRLVKNDVEAEDILQDTFVKVWCHLTNYDPARGKLSSWLLKIAHRTTLDYIRDNRLARQSLSLEITSPIIAVWPDYSMIGVIELVNERLTPEAQQLIDLIYQKGYTQQEAADYLNMPLGTVKTRTRLALRLLRKHLT